MTKPGAVELVQLPIGELKPFDKNPRRISEAGLRKLQSSIERFGFNAPVLVQKDTMMVIAGHQRIEAAKAAGIETVPVVILDLDTDEALAYNLADNRLAQESEWEASLLEELEKQLDSELMAAAGFESNEVALLLAAEKREREKTIVDDLYNDRTVEPEPTQGSGPDYYQLAYPVTREQRATILRAIGEAKKRWGLQTSVEALVRICEELTP